MIRKITDGISPIAHWRLSPELTRTSALAMVCMSVEHGPVVESKARASFLDVQRGDVVIVWELPQLLESASTCWWMGEVVFVEGSARNPMAPSLFQISDVDNGVIRWVNADCVQQVEVPMARNLPAR